MDTTSSQLPQQQAPQALQSPQSSQTHLSSSSKNLKSWFDEFKAKVSKKSQANSNNNDADQHDQIPLTVRSSSKELSSSTLSAPSPTGSALSTTTPSTLNTPGNKTKRLSPRARRVRKLSTSECHATDHGSPKSTTWTNGPATPKRQQHRRGLFWKIFGALVWLASQLMPLNYNLPWKLLCFINSSFVIIVVAMANGSSQFTAFTFVNGFVCGIGVALVGFIIVTLSFMNQILPKTQDNVTPTAKVASASNRYFPGKPDYDNVHQPQSDDTSFRDNRSDNISFNSTGFRSEDFSLFEILDENDRVAAGSHADLSDHDNYKGWMIEFIGDYEQRNTADIKLKSIYVRIESHMLYLCKPKGSISHDVDSSNLPVFTSQRVYDLSKVLKFNAHLLIPKTVRNKQKYVWSKKYPIRLDFRDVSPDGDESSGKTVQLTLLAKSCREKEEWFRRFKNIVDDNRLNLGGIEKKNSLRSEGEESNGSDNVNESFFGSLKRFRRRSPSPKRTGDHVLTSQSSHLLCDHKRVVPDDTDDQRQQHHRSQLATPSSQLVRTKSCELLNMEHKSSSGSQDSNDPQSQDIGGVELGRVDLEPSLGDDSTLTKETAELFSQAMEYSNFVDSRPSLNYHDYIEQVISSGAGATNTSDWFNALTGRIFYDVLSHDHWSTWFKRKIQRKLHRIRLPYFMETLTLTKIDLGSSPPQFLNVVSHSFDSYGLSIDFDMSYSGGLTMTFETKLNLLKIKSDNSSSGNTSNVHSFGATSVGSNQSASQEAQCNQQPMQQSPIQPDTEPPAGNWSSSGATGGGYATTGNVPGSGESSAKESSIYLGQAPVTGDSNSSESQLRPAALRAPPISLAGSARTSCESTSESGDSDSDSSSDASFDEAEPNEISDWEDYGAEKTRQNIVKFVDRIASSRYFQQATENRYIKRKLQDISNCPLVLVVQIQSLSGILTVNVPPPQTDRIWYGFKPQPELNLKALPKMGDRELNLSHVTDWIERKLAEEFRKILVIPNMEDIVLPVLKSDHLQYVNATR